MGDIRCKTHDKAGARSNDEHGSRVAKSTFFIHPVVGTLEEYVRNPEAHARDDEVD